MSDNDSSLAPAFEPVTTDKHAAWVMVTTNILIILVVLVIGTRLLTRWKAVGAFNLSDVLIAVALLPALSQATCINLACQYGLGRHRDALSDESFELYGKFFYASQLLLIVSLVLAKASIVVLMMALGPHVILVRSCQAILVATGLWGFSAIFALAFQCKLPRPWDTSSGRCFDQQAFSVYFGLVNIFTDIPAIIIPLFLVMNIQVTWMKRYQVISLFACRILVCIATALNIMTSRPYFASQDKSWENVTPTIWSQIMLSLSIITACIPCLKSVIAGLQTGLAVVTISEPLELSFSSKQGGEAAEYRTSSTTTTKFLDKINRARFPRSKYCQRTEQYLEDRKYGYKDDKSGNNIQFVGVRERRNPVTKGALFNPTTATSTSTVERSDSMEGLADGIIVQTISYSVEYEDTQSASSQQSRHSRLQDRY